MKEDTIRTGQRPHNKKSPLPSRLVILNPGQGVRSFKLAKGRITVGSDPASCGIALAHPTVSRQHAILEATQDGWFVHDLESSNGTFVNGSPAAGWTPVRHHDRLQFGAVECVLRPPLLQRYFDVVWLKRGRGSWVASAASLLIHLAIVLFISRVVLTATKPPTTDFVATTDGFFADQGPQGEPPGGEPAAGPASSNPFAANALQPMVATATITTTARAALSFSMPKVAGPAAPRLSPKTGVVRAGGGGGGTSYRSAGFGKGSGLGKGVSEWIGGGSGGIGISGRGKKLRTVNEFSVYFVIHSGDWYAALDTRKAPDGRNMEIADPGLPDVKNIRWGTFEPVPGQGPFINYFWGGNWRKPDEDNRKNLVEFTPGAMGNLLRFVRQASANGIKGAAKPAAVVLDKSLVPYTYNKTTRQMTWNPEGREKLRETLRKGLPAFTNFYGGAFGYIWNPKPDDPGHSDFTVEYLLDVRPMPPFIYFTGNDDFTLSDAEVDTLYQYILRGGAIWGDCGFAGARSKFDVAFKREMKRVIPDADKPFRALKKENDLFLAGEDAYFDRSNGLERLPYGMQFYDAPIEVIEVLPGLVSVVLTRNAYGNFLRFETAVVNNRFQVGGQLGRGNWASTMWTFREEFFRGLGEGAIVDSYMLGTNVLVYMLGRWPTVLNRPENKALLQ